MKHTPAKDTSRKLFYEFVKKGFSAKELSEARAVVLLGEEMRELPILDKLGIARHRITCIESDSRIYQDMYFWNMKRGPEEKIALYGGELNDYLKFLIDREQNVAIFNLDITGTLLNNTIPQFENVIALSKAQPKTVVGTYLSAGRDLGVLTEAFKATAWLMLFDDKFKNLIQEVASSFIQAGYKPSVALSHSFRVMHWFYHMLYALVKIQHPKRVKMMSLQRVPIKFWEKALLSKQTLTWKRVCQLISEQKHISPKIKSLQLPCALVDLQFMAYRNSHWTQICHFFRLEQSAEMTLGDVMKTMFLGLAKFKFAGVDGKLIRVNKSKGLSSFDKVSILTPAAAKKLKSSLPKNEQTTKAKKSVRPAIIPTKEAQQQLEVTTQPTVVTLPPPKKTLWNKSQGFTEAGKEFIRARARAGSKTADLAKFFPKQAPTKSISAFIAIANRN